MAFGWQRFRLGDLLLLWALVAQGWPLSPSASSIPPLTLALVLVQLLVHWHLLPALFRDHQVPSVCVSVYSVVEQRDLARLVQAPLTHFDDVHLYLNAVSLLVKGRFLEAKLGSRLFGGVVLVLLALSSLLFIVFQLLLTRLTARGEYLYQCSLGFSGVLFGLKVLVLRMSGESDVTVFGVHRVPRLVLPWFELVLVQKLVPRASLASHLAGIVAGLILVEQLLPRFYTLPMADDPTTMMTEVHAVAATDQLNDAALLEQVDGAAARHDTPSQSGGVRRVSRRRRRHHRETTSGRNAEWSLDADAVDVYNDAASPMRSLVVSWRPRLGAARRIEEGDVPVEPRRMMEIAEEDRIMYRRAPSLI